MSGSSPRPARRAPCDLRALDDVRARVADGVAASLPGPAAQALLAPAPRPGWRPGEPPQDARDAAALLFVYERDGRAHLVLTRRSAHLPTHAGQISLPGGGLADGETVTGAALREADEELGLRADDVRLLGELTALFIPVSGYLLHPIVATADGPQRFTPHEPEVAEVIETSLEGLADPRRQRVETWHRAGVAYRVPLFDVHGHVVWGATAMVLAEFLALLGHPPALDTASARRSGDSP
jgi:8-oxo-dGTP pyrophosphatase MutT (NUDIX family)